MLKVPKKIFGPRGLFLTYQLSRITNAVDIESQNLKNTILGPNIFLGTFNTVQYTPYIYDK